VTRVGGQRFKIKTIEGRTLGGKRLPRYVEPLFEKEAAKPSESKGKHSEKPKRTGSAAFHGSFFK